MCHDEAGHIQPFHSLPVISSEQKIYSKHLALYMASSWDLYYDEARDHEAAIPAFGAIAAMALSAFLDGTNNHPTCLVFLSLRLL